MAVTRYAGDRFVGDVASNDNSLTGVLDGAYYINSGNLTQFVKRAGGWQALAGGGGGGSPGGSNTQVQFNNAGSFGASEGLTYSYSNGLDVNTLRISGTIYDSNNYVGDGGMVLTSEGATGVNWKSIESVLSGVGGSGVANYGARWSDEDTLTSGTIYDDGDVGIGTANPGAKLHVVGTALVTSTANFNGNYTNFGGGSGGSGASIESNGRITTDNNIGIGTTTPNELLEIFSTGSNTNAKIRLSSAGNNTGGRGIEFFDGAYNRWRIATVGANGNFEIHRSTTGNSWEAVPAISIDKADGYVGIGTTDPGTKLYVLENDNNWAAIIKNTNANGYGLSIDCIGNTGTTVYALGVYTGAGTGFFVRNKGNCGIGTTAPGAAKLDIYHDGGFTNDLPTARIYHRNNPDSGNARVAALDVDVGVSNGDLFHHGYVQLFQHFTGAAYNSPRLYFSSNSYSSSTNHRQWWGIQALADTTATGDRLAFTCDLSSTNPTATPVHIMSLKTDGNVGIGVTAPDYKLEVQGSVTGDWLSRIYNTATTGNHSGLLVRIDNPSSTGIILGANANGTYRFVVKPDGHVGIGTTAPWTRFTVSGGTTAEADDFIPMSVSPSVAGGNSAGILFGVYPLVGYAKQGIFWERYVANGGYGGRGKLHFVNRDAVDDSVPTIADSKMTILEDGNVGIGTTSPSTLLHIDDDTNAAGLTIKGAGPGYVNAAIVLKATNNTSYRGLGVFMHDAGGDTEWYAGTPYAAADQYMIARKASQASSDYGTAVTGNALFTVKNDGKVGIGTTTPDAELQVMNNDSSSYRFGYGGTSDVYFDADDVYFRSDNGGANDITKKGGSLGIGVVNAEHKLHVAGDAIISGYLYDSTNSTGTDGYVFTTKENGPRWEAIEDVLSGVGGNGTANYVPKWEDSDTIGNSIIYDNGSNIGIGNAVPSGTLDIVGSNGTVDVAADGDAQELIIRNNDRAGIQILSSESSSKMGSILFGSASDANGANISYFPYDKLLRLGTQVADGQVALRAANGVEAVRIDENGNVGIGTNDPSVGLQVGNSVLNETKQVVFNSEGGVPAGLTVKARVNRAKLAVSDNDSNAYVIAEGLRAFFGATDSGTSTNIAVQTDGNVGIGTTDPAYLFDVSDDSSNIAIFRSSVTNYARVIIRAGAAGDAQLSFQNNTSTKWTIGNDGGDSDKFKIETGGGAFGASPLVCILSGGNFGIGTDTPLGLLHLNGANTQVYYEESDAATNTKLWKLGAQGGTFVGRAMLDSDSGGSVWLQVDRTTNTIDSVSFPAGNLGVNTLLPEHKLHVAGDAIISGYLYDSTNSTGVDGYVLTSREDGPQWDYIEDILSGVGGNGTANYVPKWIDSDTLGDSVIAESGGNIGIGTVTPEQLFEISATGDAAIQFQSTKTSLANDDPIGSIIFKNNDSSGTDPHICGKIASIAETVYGRAGLAFSTGRTSEFAERMRIRWDGHVGIGTNSPNVANAAAGNTVLTIKNQTNPYAGIIEFICGATSSNGNSLGVLRFLDGSSENAQIEVARESATDDAWMAFKTKKTGGSLTTHLFIASDGNVGIGTAVPGSNTLYVNGNCRAAELDLPSGGVLDWANGDARIVEGEQSNYSLSFKTYDGTSAVPTRMFIRGGTTDNLVGIGTNNPLTPLHIYTDSASAQEIFFDNDGAGEVGITFRTDRNTDGNLANFIRFDAADDGGNNTRYSTIESFIVDNTDTTEDGRLTFSTMVGGTDTETMHIVGGKVGIGIDAPDTKLQVVVDSSDGSASTHGVHFGTATNGLNIGANDSGNYAWIQTKSNDDLVINPYGAKVGIGTASPGVKLHVYGGNIRISSTDDKPQLEFFETAAARWVIGHSTAPNNYFAISEGSDVAASERLVIAPTTGSVGIGYPTPAYALDIRRAAADIFISSTTGTNRTGFQAANTGGTSYFYRDASSGTGVFSGSTAYATIIGGTGAYSLHLGTNGAVKMTIDSAGNVGIGTASPDTKLEISSGEMGSTAEFVGLKVTHSDHDASVASEASMRLAYTHSGGEAYSYIKLIESATNSFDGHLTIGTPKNNGSGGSTTNEWVRIKNDGNVGIGTYAPGYRFEVRESSATWLSRIYNTGTGNGLLVRVDSGSSDAILSTHNGTNHLFVVKGDGNVGIGTYTPTTLFESNVNSASVGTDSVTARNTGVTTIGHSVGYRYQFNTAVPAASRAILEHTNSGRGRLGFFVSTDGAVGNLTEYLSIKSDGVVDINSAKLKINGASGTDGQVLTTDGAGGIAWETNGSGTVTSVGINGGTGLDVTNSPITTSGNITVSLDLNELGQAGVLAGSDCLVVVDGTDTKKETISGINLTIFNNDAGWTNNAGTVTSVTAGVGLTMSAGSSTVNPTLATKLDELTNMTAAVVGGTDQLILLDNGDDRRKTINTIDLGQFNNDQGWTSNAGTVTSVTAGTGMTQTGSATGATTLNVGGGVGIDANASNISLNLSELTSTNAPVTADKMVFIDNGANASFEFSDVPLSIFSNDVGWITSTVTSPLTVTKSSGLAALTLRSNPANQVADIGGELIFQATYRATSDTTQVARIKGTRENATTNNWAGRLTFHTSPGGDSPSASTEQMRIQSDGNVGIGTNDPGELLQVKGNVMLRGGTNHRYKVANDSNNNWAEIGNDGASGENTLEFFTGSSSVPSMSITNAKHVNIGSGNLQMGGTNIINSGRAMYNLESFKLADSKIAYFGTGNDLQIYHSGTHSYIKEAGNGALKIWGDDVRIENASERNVFKAIGTAVELYFDNGSATSKKLETTSTGVSVTGGVAATSFSGNGASVTNLNALNITAGTVATARLGTGTADSSTFLRGDNTWVANANGTVTSVTAGTGMTQTGTSTVNPTLNVIGGTGITANANDIAITDTAVSAGSYTYASITVDAQGRLTAASSGSAPGGGTVTGTGTDNYIPRWNGTTAIQDSVLFYAADNGNVGIGNAAPQHLLHVGAVLGTALNNSSILLRNADTKYTAIVAGSHNSTTYNETAVALKIFPNGGTRGAGKYSNGISFQHLNPNTYPGYDHGSQAAIALRYTSGSNAEQSALTFLVTSTATAGDQPTEKMCILPDGNVGIGTDDPSALLEVYKATVADSASELLKVVGTNDAQLRVEGANDNTSVGYGTNRSGGALMLRNTNSTVGNYESICFSNADNYVNAGIHAINVAHGVGGATRGRLEFWTRNTGNNYHKALEISDSSAVTFHTSTGAVAYTLPNSDGNAGYHLETNGSGTVTWAAGGAGTVTSITAGDGLSGGTITTSGTIANTDKGSSQNIFKKVRTSNSAGNQIGLSTANSNDDTIDFRQGTGITLATSGDVVTITAANNGTVTGTGTTNYISKWTGTSSQGNSTISDNGSIVTVDSKLSVVSNFVGSSVYANFGPTTLSGSDTREGGIQIHASGGANDKTWGIWADANNPVGLRFEYLGARATAFGSGTDVLTLDGPNNRVGIGNPSPIAQLHLQVNASGGHLHLTRADNSLTGQMGEITFGNRNYDDYLCKIRATCDSTAATAAGAGGFLAFDTEASGGSLTEQLRIAADGNVGIGTNNPSKLLDVNGTAYFRDDIYFGNTVLNPASGFSNQTGMGWDKSTGALQIASTGTAALEVGRHTNTGSIFVCRYGSFVKATIDTSGDMSISGTLSEASSLAIKENVETYSPSLEKINKMRAVRFNKKKSKKKEVGLVAEELAEMFPELVEMDKDGKPCGVNYSRAVAVLLHGFKELYKEVKELKEKI